MLKSSTWKVLFLSIGVLFNLPASAAEIILWEHERDEIVKVLDDIIKEFESANKGVKIKRSHYKTEDLRTQFQTAALGGGGPTMLIGPNDFAGPLSLMGLIANVQKDFSAADHFPESVAAVQDATGIWGFPISRGNHLMLFVNKKLVKSAPSTVEELVSVAKANTSKKIYGFAYNLTEPFFFAPFMLAFGGKLLVNGKPDLNTPQVVEALSFAKDLKFKDKIVPNDCDYTCADTLFVEGKAAMTINGDWSVAKYKETLKDNLIIAPLPELKAKGQWMRPLVSGKYVFINERSKGEARKGALTFAKYLMSKSVQERFAKDGGRLPSLKAASESDTVTKDEDLLASQNALQHGEGMPMDVGMRAVWDAMRPQLQGVMAGRIEPKAAAAAMQKDAEIKIKEMQQ